MAVGRKALCYNQVITYSHLQFVLSITPVSRDIPALVLEVQNFGLVGSFQSFWDIMFPSVLDLSLPSQVLLSVDLFGVEAKL